MFSLTVGKKDRCTKFFRLINKIHHAPPHSASLPLLPWSLRLSPKIPLPLSLHSMGGGTGRRGRGWRKVWLGSGTRGGGVVEEEDDTAADSGREAERLLHCGARGDSARSAPPSPRSSPALSPPFPHHHPSPLSDLAWAVVEAVAGSAAVVRWRRWRPGARQRRRGGGGGSCWPLQGRQWQPRVRRRRRRWFSFILLLLMCWYLWCCVFDWCLNDLQKLMWMLECYINIHFQFFVNGKLWLWMEIVDANLCGFVDRVLTEADGVVSLRPCFLTLANINTSSWCSAPPMLSYFRQRKWIGASGWLRPTKILYYHWPLHADGAIGRQ